MVLINWTEQSVLDLKNIYDYISKDSHHYAKITVKKIQVRTEVLKLYPLSGRIIPEINKVEFKELIEGNYRIMYKIVNEQRIDILSVYHSARNFSQLL